ncbi:hypothetical protein HYT57_03560 [Candidatus Woesearchaeota archaeon]|nr:hypothetical protein [Candidatus Woesearchaeota archaeon]
MPTSEKEIGRIILFKIATELLDFDFIGKVMHRSLEFKYPESASLYVRNVTEGYMYGSNGNSARTLSKTRSLHRLSTLVYALGIPEREGFIGFIRSVDADFIYPPNTNIEFGILPLMGRTLPDKIKSLEENVSERVSLCCDEIRTLLEEAKKPNKTPWIYHSSLQAYGECLEILERHFSEAKK